MPFIDNRPYEQPRAKVRNHKKRCTRTFKCDNDYVPQIQAFMAGRPDSEVVVIDYYVTEGQATGSFIYTARGANKTDITRKCKDLEIQFTGSPDTVRLCSCLNNDDESCMED